MLSVPKQVRILGRTLSLRPDFEACKASQVKGQYLEDEFYVIYDPTRPLPVLQEVMLHELFHAIWSSTSLETRIPSGGADSQGELTIQDITPCLLAILRENPKLVAFLLQD